MKIDSISFIIIVLLSNTISIKSKNKLLNISLDLSCSEIADFLKQLIKIKTNLDQIKKSFFERVTYFQSYVSPDSKNV